MSVDEHFIRQYCCSTPASTAYPDVPSITDIMKFLDLKCGFSKLKRIYHLIVLVHLEEHIEAFYIKRLAGNKDEKTTRTGQFWLSSKY